MQTRLGGCSLQVRIASGTIFRVAVKLDENAVIKNFARRREFRDPSKMLSRSGQNLPSTVFFRDTVFQATRSLVSLYRILFSCPKPVGFSLEMGARVGRIEG
jgi:hypothetical protein